MPNGITYDWLPPPEDALSCVLLRGRSVLVFERVECAGGGEVRSKSTSLTERLWEVLDGGGVRVDWAKGGSLDMKTSTSTEGSCGLCKWLAAL